MTVTLERPPTHEQLAVELPSLHPDFYQYVRRTPLERRAHLLPDGKPLDVKLESEQHTGSFKYRGAIQAMLEADPSTPLTIASAGSFALGCAQAAHSLDRKLTMYTLDTIAPSKREAINPLLSDKVSLEVVEGDFSTALHTATSAPGRFISPFDDEHVIAAHSTPALEVLAEYPEDEPLTIFVPVGGGGLLAGTLMASVDRPNVTVVGVMLAGNDSLELSLAADSLQPATQLDTLCEGSAVAQVGKLPFEIARQHGDRLKLITVTRADVGEASYLETLKRQQFYSDYHGSIYDNFPETTALLSIAGARRYAEQNPGFAGHAIAICTGGNSDPVRDQTATETYHDIRCKNAAVPAGSRAVAMFGGGF